MSSIISGHISHAFLRRRKDSEAHNALPMPLKDLSFLRDGGVGTKLRACMSDAYFAALVNGWISARTARPSKTKTSLLRRNPSNPKKFMEPDPLKPSIGLLVKLGSIAVASIEP